MPKKPVLWTVLWLLLFRVAPTSGEIAPRMAMQQALETRVRAFAGILGVVAIDLESGEELAVNGDLRFPTASLIKVPVMVEVFHQLAEGKLRRDALVTLRAED